MDWIADFYRKQGAWSDAYSGPPVARHRQKAALIGALSGRSEPLRVLELGAGGGQCAAAAADLGHEVIAIELVESSATHATGLAATRSGMRVIQGDFYTVDPGGRVDVVCYWDGFGVGSDADQRRLLQRIKGWLREGGCALIDIYTPWHAASTIGKSWQVGDAVRAYDFDAQGCRWLDTWRAASGRGEAVTQSLRCYSPADLELLLEGTGLRLASVTPGSGPGPSGDWLDQAPLGRALSYTAKLIR